MTHTYGIYHVSELFPNIYRIENSHVFMDLIVGTHHALLWDTGYGYADLMKVIRQITQLPLYVLNSHGHLDHACGNWQFSKVYIHPDDMALCREHNSPHTRMLELASAELPEDFDRDAYLHRGHGSLQPLQECDSFDLGGITLEVVSLPGHTAGSIGLWCKELKLIYLGDAANDFVWLFLPEARQLSVYRSTLGKLDSMDFEWMIQSHYPDLLPKERLKWYIDLVDHLDYHSGQIVPPPIETGIEARICIRGGLTLDDWGRENFAAILIGKDKWTKSSRRLVS